MPPIPDRPTEEDARAALAKLEDLLFEFPFVDEVSRSAYQLVICDEAHTALGEKTAAAIRRFSEPIYVGMTATEELIAKQVSDVFPASVDDLPLAEAARRGLIAPLRCLRVPPVAAINSVPIVGGDFEERALAAALDHTALNQAAASLYRDRFGPTPGIVRGGRRIARGRQVPGRIPWYPDDQRIPAPRRHRHHRDERCRRRRSSHVSQLPRLAVLRARPAPMSCFCHRWCW